MSNFGPGILVTAAFIGPGTVTVCILAGVKFGYSLLWAMLLSVAFCLVLQEMSARLGLVTQKGLGEVIGTLFTNKVLRWSIISLVFMAIFIGNAAYEAGNISGGVLGLEIVIPDTTITFWNLELNYLSPLIGLFAFGILISGNYKIIEKGLITLVIGMSLCFLGTVILLKPDLAAIFSGFVPHFNESQILAIVALIGTTVVPYNLFLHAAVIKEKWKNTTDIHFVRRDTIIAIVLGGLVSLAIIICGAALEGQEVSNATDLARSLEPLFGTNAKYIIALGLFAAGITSAITAPLATAYVVSGCLGWSPNLKAWRFRWIWILVLLSGVLFSSLGIKPILIIQFAQVANGIVLPFVAILLVWLMNQKEILGNYTNTLAQNVLAILVVCITLFLGARSIGLVFF
ncbi:NRAMP (natural resistance-associated macrophage protein)-like metal ion transporter [Aquimarina brevivitae]|uniref:NRAMP (Natural resistance-associated macrophage protein)-like metal ion transporter n=1 Tax=Aquimarina brevivitae TaxID=323412 RepID=A0A4Q7NYJ1_9FLAO|nr:NRAMP (natural resistance-associated macrophage protein)-like metal ion transporter [Aquimarina brevivitae]